jgi:hypothetical protein
MPPTASALAGQLGFVEGDKGAHMARTIMVTELSQLLAAVRIGAASSAYKTAALEDNALAKQTMANRKNTLRNLRLLYGLDESLPIFRILRHLWRDQAARPLLATTLALARDPVLRLSVPTVLNLPRGTAVDRDDFLPALASQGDRFAASTRKSVTQNIAGTWTQAGFLSGVIKKTRSNPPVTPANAAYCTCLGYLTGLRGATLLGSTWLRLLDRQPGDVRDLLATASRAGWIDFKSSGGVVNLSPRGMLTPREMVIADQLAHEEAKA